MESERNEALRKRMKPNMEEKEEDHSSNGTVMEITEKEQSETNIVVSEEMELNISHILEKIERFTQLVSELLESGKMMFKELSNEFEDRLIVIHKEQMEKWQEEIKDLRLVDASNEEASALLNNARVLLQNPLFDASKHNCTITYHGYYNGSSLQNNPSTVVIPRNRMEII